MARKPKPPAPKQSGSIIPKGEGKWLVRWYLGTDSTGKRVYNSETVKGTYGQAEKVRNKKLTAKDEGTLVATTRLTLCEYLTGFKLPVELDAARAAANLNGLEEVAVYKGWLGSRVSISPKTKRDYCARMRFDVLPTLGHHRLTSLTRLQLQEFIAYLATDRKLSQRTIEYTIVVLKNAMRQAVLDGLVGRNPTDGLELPPKDHSEPEVHTPEQMMALMSHPGLSPMRRAMWTVALTAGMRPQEYLALTWDDIDTTTHTITVRRAMVEVKAGEWIVGDTKTDHSVRNIVVPPETISALQEHKKVQNIQIMKCGEHHARLGVVFSGPLGNHLDISAVRRGWKHDCAAAGIPVIKLYSSRHSHLTAFLAAGGHAKVAQERAGHSTIQTTMNTYTHVLPSMQKEAAVLVGSILFPTPKTGT